MLLDGKKGLVVGIANGNSIASCHSFIRMPRLAEPLMTQGGCLLTVTFYGSEKVVADYNLMGPVKAPLTGNVE